MQRRLPGHSTCILGRHSPGSIAQVPFADLVTLRDPEFSISIWKELETSRFRIPKNRLFMRVSVRFRGRHGSWTILHRKNKMEIVVEELDQTLNKRGPICKCVFTGNPGGCKGLREIVCECIKAADRDRGDNDRSHLIRRRRGALG